MDKFTFPFVNIRGGKISMKAKTFIIMLSLLFGVCCFAGQEKAVTITGLVVDYPRQPVRDAEVIAYEEFTDSYGEKQYWKYLGNITKTDLNGHFILNTKVCALYNVFIVAKKQGLAFGWDRLDSISEKGIKYHSNIILEKPSTLAGKLTDTNGKPVTRAKIQAIPMSGSIPHFVRSTVY